jgi:hypothetical protein
VSKIGRKIMQINSKFKIQNSKLFTVLSFKDHHWRVGGARLKADPPMMTRRAGRVFIATKKPRPKAWLNN